MFTNADWTNTLILDSLCPLLVLCDTLKGVTPLILHIKVCLKVLLSVEKGCVNDVTALGLRKFEILKINPWVWSLKEVDLPDLCSLLRISAIDANSSRLH